MAFDLEMEFILSARPQRVMELLTDPGLIRKWSGADAVLENKPGGRFEMFDGWVTGNVTNTTANELGYTWKPGDWDEDAEPSEVHYLLKEDEAGTKVFLKHTGFPNASEMEGHKSGWADFFFTPMEDYIMVTEKS
jgi:uncharacterized protein YndB with AHSA1/START domain